MILYGRNAVREALRGRRSHAVEEIWASGGAARESWLRGLNVKPASAREIERRCGSSAHQGICAQA
ncbi:MAG TPA: RNA methyltransferase substrate-binding domain-containing protein, partial [Solirubrobacteraceae bacterium]